MVSRINNERYPHGPSARHSQQPQDTPTNTTTGYLLHPQIMARGHGRYPADTTHHQPPALHSRARPIQRLGLGEWNQISRFLLPRDLQRLAQTCTHMRAVGHRLMKEVNASTFSRVFHANYARSIPIGAHPVAFLRLADRCGNSAAHLLTHAPNINLLDLRALTGTGAAEIIRLAQLHPNARVVLNRDQKSDLTQELLAQAIAAMTITSRMNTATTPESARHMDLDCDMRLQTIVDQVPANLLTAITLEMVAQASRYPDDESPDFNPAYEAWQTQRMALLASTLLARCQRENMLGNPTRLLLAVDGIRRFMWNTPVHKHHHLLLNSELALALEGDRIHDNITCLGILSVLASTLQTEHELSIRPNRPSSVACEPDQIRFSPQQLLGTLLSWGLDPYRRDSQHQNVFDRLESRHLFKEAKRLRQATIEAIALSSRHQALTSAPDLSQCTVS